MRHKTKEGYGIMAVKIRLARFGKKKKPFYRVVVAPEAAPRDGRFIAVLGTYDPCSNPAVISINKEKAADWVKKGAQPTPAAEQILRKEGVFKG
jgi:small subunit ribosomal protein S16